MPIKFRRQLNPTHDRNIIYIEYPIGSNKWVRHKDNEYLQRKTHEAANIGKKIKTD